MSQPYPPPYPQSSPQTPSAYSPYPQNAYQQPAAAPQYAQNAYQPPVAAQYAQNAYQQPPAIPSAIGAAGAVPPDILQQAATYQLGTSLQTYKPRFSPMVAVGIAVGVSIFDIIVMVAILVASGYFLGILIFIPIAMIVFAVRALMVGNTQIYIFTNGLIQAKGQQREMIRWDQVEAVWQKVVRTRYYFYYSTSYKYTVRRNDGASFTFGSPLQGIADLGKTIQQEVSSLHTPRAIAAYNSGAPVTFGLFTLGTQGISNGRELLPWNMVKGISVNRGMASVYKEGQMLRWAAADVSSIPNYPVFVNVANHALRAMGKAVQ